jgi:uncharacterized protein (TIGR00255 family)
MIISMTGFGRSVVSSNLGKIIIEITSINKRFLEVNIFLPRSVAFFEHEIRKWIEEKISRGQITVRCEYSPSGKSIESFLPDVEFLKNLKKGWEKVSKDVGYKKEEISLEFLLQQIKYGPSEKIQDITSFRNLLVKAVNSATKNLLSMKSKEGKILLVDMEKRIRFITKELLNIKKLAPCTKEDFAKKIKLKLEEIFKDKEDYEDRLLKEVAMFAEKIDITEEITRLDLHLKQFLSLLKSKQEVIGRKLDFLLQECMREANTMSAKASDAKISNGVVEIKSELEKIKEQIQNIE